MDFKGPGTTFMQSPSNDPYAAITSRDILKLVVALGLHQQSLGALGNF